MSRSFGFPELTRLLDVVDARPLLEELASSGVFERIPYDGELICPACGSPEALRTKYVCPFCGKYDLERGSLIEHYPCGYTGFRREFTSGEDLICPKCRKELRLVGTDYRIVENMFNCRGCKANFSVPNITHTCHNCKRDLRLEEPDQRIAWGYHFREDMRGEVLANCVMDTAILNRYQAAGYAVERLRQLKGESGVPHLFDIVATKNGEDTVMVIASDRAAVGSQDVVGFFAKKVDVHPRQAILIAIPGMTEEARRLANAYGIEVVEGRDLQQVLDQLQDRLQNERQPAVREPDSAATLIRDRRRRIEELLQSDTRTMPGKGLF